MNKQFAHLAVALGLGLAAYWLATHYIEATHAQLLGTVVCLIALWTTEALPLGAVSLLPVVAFPTLDILDTDAVASNYAKSIVFLFLGGFMMAIATEKTNLHQAVAARILAVFPATLRGIIFALALCSAFLSSLISNTTTALLLIPVASFLTQDKALRTRFVLAIAYGASIGGIITPIGTPPNLILLGFLGDQGLQSPSFINWMRLTVPLALVMLTIVSTALSTGLGGHAVGSLKRGEQLSPDQKRLLKILGALVVLLLANSPVDPYYSGLGLNEKGILLAFGLLMFFPKVGFLTWADSRKIPFEIVFLFGAGFSIAAAFSQTGLAGLLAAYLYGLSELAPFALLLVVAALVTFTTEITSNTALISIALPVLYSLGGAGGLNADLLMLSATVCASYAFMLPIATPPNAIAVGTGYVDIRTMARFGLLFNALGVLSVACTAYFYWQWVL